MTNKKTSVGILGGGISGLSTAYALSRKNIPVTIYEKSGRLGGAISSVQDGQWLVEEGPNTLMINTEAHWNLFDELGLRKDISEAGKSAKKRFIIKDDELVPLPMGFVDFLKTPLLSLSGKLRLLKEPFASPSPKHDESIAAFIERRLGKEVLHYAVNPFVSGIYAGDPGKLSIKHTFSHLWDLEQKHGSLLKGVIKGSKNKSSSRRALISFKNGIQQLVQALADNIIGNIHLDTEVKAITKNEERWIVDGFKKGEQITGQHGCLVSTLPTYTLGDIFPGKRCKKLSALPYAPMQMLALGFQKDQISHPLDGFGMLAPEVENLHFLGSLFSSSLFDGRVPDGHHLITSFIGGARQPDLAKKTAEELQSMLLDELDQLIGISGKPVFLHHRYWERAIPQYEVGYDYFLSLMKEVEKNNHGLYLEGNFRGGVSVPDCISSGFETAQKAAAFLKSTE